MSFPLLFSALYLVDFLLLPEQKTSDTIESIINVTMSQDNGYGFRKSKVVGYKYITVNDFVFSSEKQKIRAPEIDIIVSPLFKTVKSVKADAKNIPLQSGLYGLDGVLLVAIFISILISFLYLLLKKVLSENAQLNLIYWNLFLLVIWGILFIKFVA
jgi:hypothetical protein